MKIFAASDLHGREKYLQKIINYINKRKDIDIVLFCGDIAKDYEESSITELKKLQKEDYNYLKSMIEKINTKKVYYIRGNHDVFTPEKDDIRFLSNIYKIDNNVDFIPFEMMCIEFYNTNREGSEKDLKIALELLGNLKGKILVSHQPPYKILDKGVNGINYGSRAIRNMILNEEPSLVFCGHVHEGFGVKRLGNTWVINCASDVHRCRGIFYDTESKKYEKIIL